MSKRRTVFYRDLEQRISELGGMHNAHLHIDRVGTLDPLYWEGSGVDPREISAVPLMAKHHMIGALHNGPAYQPEELARRVNECLDHMVDVGTTRADTFVDVTPDNIRMQALERLLAIREERRGEIDFRLGAYSPMGYRDDDPGRWELLIEGAGRAQFLGCLPEADDHADYPEHIGFQEHCRRMLQLGQELGLEVHVHVDQRNEPSEKGTELLLDALDEVGQPGSAEGPGVWAVHVISPSTYDEPRFQRMLERLVEHDVGIIVSPSAALGMRQLRPLQGPTFNSIARVMDFLEAGLLVRLGSDNMADICSPSTTADLVDEVFVLSAALRFYHVETLARVAAGQRLAPEELEFVKRHQEHDRREVERTIPILCERS